MPGVTQILSDLGIADYSFLPTATREMALQRGRIVHRLTELSDRGTLDESTVDPALRGYLDAWRRFVGQYRIDHWHHIEQPMHNALLGYCGTPDRISGELLIDVKTNSIPRWTRLQTAAYAMFLDYLPQRLAVELHDDGTYSVDRYSRVDLFRERQAWIGCLTAWRCRREYANHA